MIDPMHLCRVCGLDHGYNIWGDDGKSPTYDICECCGTEFGYHDATLKGVLRKRQEWIDSGAKWAEPDEKPSDWVLAEYLARIPPEFR